MGLRLVAARKKLCRGLIAMNFAVEGIDMHVTDCSPPESLVLSRENSNP